MQFSVVLSTAQDRKCVEMMLFVNHCGTYEIFMISPHPAKFILPSQLTLQPLKSSSISICEKKIFFFCCYLFFFCQIERKLKINFVIKYLLKSFSFIHAPFICDWEWSNIILFLFIILTSGWWSALSLDFYFFLLSPLFHPLTHTYTTTTNFSSL